jgi:hypothetical protein
MDKFNFVLNGIMEFRSINYSEALKDNVISLNGSKRSFFGSTDLILTIQKSTKDTNAAFVSFEKKGDQQSLDIPKHILLDILKTTGLLDSKLQMKIDLIFGDRRIEFINGQVVIS